MQFWSKRNAAGSEALKNLAEFPGMEAIFLVGVNRVQRSGIGIGRDPDRRVDQRALKRL